MDEVELQRAYFARVAPDYDALHTLEDEHGMALRWLDGVIDQFGFESFLEVGAGTGRLMAQLQAARPSLHVVGVEPVSELRAEGHVRGLPEASLVDGDGYALAFDDCSFDVVAEFAVLHHVRHPEKVVAEMLRVARRAVFISDVNNFATGRLEARLLKNALRILRLWPVADYLKTRGRGFYVSAGDGVAYSYSLFSTYSQLREACESVFLLTTAGPGDSANPMLSASHGALLGLKDARART